LHNGDNKYAISVVKRNGPQDQELKRLAWAIAAPHYTFRIHQSAPPFRKQLSTSQSAHRFTIPLLYLYSSSLSLGSLYAYLPDTAKMGRKFFVGGNFKMYVNALFQVPPSTLTFPLLLGDLAC
jgi:hypothetical protein